MTRFKYFENDASVARGAPRLATPQRLNNRRVTTRPVPAFDVDLSNSRRSIVRDSTNRRNSRRVLRPRFREKASRRCSMKNKIDTRFVFRVVRAYTGKRRKARRSQIEEEGE